MRPDGAPKIPFAAAQSETRDAFSCFFHHADEISTRPGLIHASKIARRKRATARVSKLLQAEEAVSTTPQSMKLTVMYFPVGNFCINRLVGY